MTPSSPDRSRSATPRSLLLVCACGTFFVLGAHDGSLGVLLPQMAATYDVSRAAISLPYVGAAGGYILACLVSGWLASRIGRKSLLLLGIGSFSLGTLGLGLQPPLLLVGAAPIAIGFGAGSGELGWNEGISATPEPAAALNALHASFGIGALVGPLGTSALLAASWSWTDIYRLLAVLGVLVAVAAQLLLLPSAEKDDASADTLLQALGSRAAVAIATAICFFMGTEFALGDWNFSFLVEERGLTVVEAGRLGSSYWLGITCGRLALAFMNIPRGERTVLTGCVGCAATGIALLWAFPQTPAMLVGLFVVGLGLGPILPTALALLARETTSSSLLGAVSLVACLGSLGKGIFPWLGGLLLDRTSVAVLPVYGLVLLVGMNFCLQQLFAMGRE